MTQKSTESAVVALHNFMSQLHGVANYDCLNKFGKAHRPFYRYSCKAMGDQVFGTGRSKKDAKNVVARLMLEQLSLRGYLVPPEFRSPEAMNAIMERAGIPTRSFVILCNEMCSQYHLDPVEYEVVKSESSGLTNFTVKARLGHVQRIATASSKRMATQLAAEQIYKYLSRRLSGTRTFNEEEAMRRAYERAMAPIVEDAAAAAAAAAADRTDEGGDEAGGSQEEQKTENTNTAGNSSARLEMDHSGPEPMDEGSVATTSRQYDEEARAAAISAMSFIERTMERLGI